MYVGRIVAVGMTKAGQLAAMYRVSSRSFPNREAKVLDKAIAVLPKAGFEDDIHRNPYIAYNCLRLVGPYAVATNGSHTDPVTEKLAAGMNMRDALVAGLFGMDYEHDTLNTPPHRRRRREGRRQGLPRHRPPRRPPCRRVRPRPRPGLLRLHLRAQRALRALSRRGVRRRFGRRRLPVRARPGCLRQPRTPDHRRLRRRDRRQLRDRRRRRPAGLARTQGTGT